MCNCDECREKRENRIVSVRACGYILLAIGIASMVKTTEITEINIMAIEAVITLLALVFGSLLLSYPSKTILVYLGRKEVEHEIDKTANTDRGVGNPG